MEQHDDSGSFTPDAYHRPGPQAAASTISPSRGRWRLPAVVTTMAVVAALCVHSGTATHATAAPRLTGVSALTAKGTGAVTGTGSQSAYGMNVAPDTDTTSGGSGGSSVQGGMHGAFNLYDGVGGGIEFWFDPSTGDLTVAIGAGVGEGGGGVLGTYAASDVPAPGAYVYANADLTAGTVATVNVAENYSLTDGKFVGQFSTTVQGRTLTIASDGTTTFDVSVNAAEGAEGFTGAIGVDYTFKFNVTDFLNVIWDAIVDFFTDDFFLEDGDETGDDTYEYEDDSSTDDDSEVTTDDSTDDDSATTTDDSTDDSTDASTDASDDSSDGGDSSDSGGCAVSYSYAPDASSTLSRAHTAVIVPAYVEPVDSDDSGCE